MPTLKNLHQQAKARRDGKPAFTLLELIVVLLVLGILAAIAVPTFNRVKENSVVRVAQTTLEAAARNGEAIAKSDPNASDADIAAAVESEFTAGSGLTVSVVDDTVTVSQSNGSVTASGSVEFTNGVPTITNASVSGSPATTVAPTTTTTVAAPVVYAIGDVGPGGGRVFITPSTAGNATGLYFEAAPFADQVQAQWCSNTDTLLGALGTAIGTGQSNTTTAYYTCTSGAIDIADDYSNNGFSDWFLPSKDELNAMYDARNSLGGFSAGAYWSSSERVAYYDKITGLPVAGVPITDQALYKYFGDGIVWLTVVHTKSFTHHVRPVRMFS